MKGLTLWPRQKLKVWASHCRKTCTFSKKYPENSEIQRPPREINPPRNNHRSEKTSYRGNIIQQNDHLYLQQLPRPYAKGLAASNFVFFWNRSIRSFLRKSDLRTNSFIRAFVEVISEANAKFSFHFPKQQLVISSSHTFTLTLLQSISSMLSAL